MPRDDPRKRQDADDKSEEARRKIKEAEDLRKTNPDHLVSMDTTYYSTRAKYHFLHNMPNYTTMTLPMGVTYKSESRGEMSLLAMVSIDETLKNLIVDLGTMLDTVTAGVELKLWMRNTSSRNSAHEKVEKSVTAQNINQLFRFCVGKGFGEFGLEVIRPTSKPAVNTPLPVRNFQTPKPAMPIPFPIGNFHGRGWPHDQWNPSW